MKYHILKELIKKSIELNHLSNELHNIRIEKFKLANLNIKITKDLKEANSLIKLHNINK